MTHDAPRRVLVVEDDTTTADLVALYLRHAGFRVDVEHAGDRAAERMDREAYDLMVLDVMLPGVDGLELCRRARARGAAGVILLTARSLEDDRVAGLELGADDYVTKPFSPRELVARVQAVARRVEAQGGTLLRRGDLTLDLLRETVEVRGHPVDLTATEFRILAELARRPGHLKTRAQLVDAARDDVDRPQERTVDVHVLNLRRKLEADPTDPRLILTVRGRGYRFADDS